MNNRTLRILNLRTYPWIFLGTLMIAGALFGMFISYLLTPVYEAKATITANMEIVRNGNITEIMVDSQMTVIGSQIFDSKAVNAVLLAERGLGHNLTYEDFRESAGYENQMMNTVLKYRHSDPVVAQRVVNSWANAFFNRLFEAHPHGLMVSQARALIQDIRQCKTDPKINETNFCQMLTPEIEKQLTNEANAVITKEAPLSMGLTAEISITNLIPADIPDTPLRYTRGSLVLAGAAIGFVLGIVLTESFFKKHDDPT